MDAETFFRFCTEVGRRAASVCQRVRAEQVVDAQQKTGREPVTVADYASQAVILDALRRQFPEHAVLSEEGAGSLRGDPTGPIARRVVELVRDAVPDLSSAAEGDVFDAIDHAGRSESPYVWAIDPIDGTKGFLRGDHYAIAIGLLHHHRPIAGALVCPRLEPLAGGPEGVLHLSFRGAGAFEAPLSGEEERRPLHVSEVDVPAHVRVLGSVESSHGDPRLLRELVDGLGFGGGIVRIDSQVKYAVLARGEAEVYLRPRSRPDWRDNVWDHAAGVAILEAAGGRATDTLGAPLDFSHGAKLEANVGVLATNGPLHDEIVRFLTPRVEAG